MVNEPRRREGAQLLLRFSDGSDLKDRLDKVAQANNRSLTAEILHRLEQSLRGTGRPAVASTGDFESRLAQIEKLLNKIGSDDMFIDNFNKPLQDLFIDFRKHPTGQIGEK